MEQNVSTQDRDCKTNITNSSMRNRTVCVGTQCNTTEDGKLEVNKDHKTVVDTHTFSQKKDQKDKIQENISGVANTLIYASTDIGIQCNILKYCEFLEEKISDKTVHNIKCSFISSQSLSSINQRPKISCISWIKKKSFSVIIKVTIAFIFVLCHLQKVI